MAEPSPPSPEAPEDPPRPRTQAKGEAQPSVRDNFIGMTIGDTKLTRQVGEGGMGLIYEGWQEPPGRTVAVKLLRDALPSEEAIFRFKHEARVLASLRHPAIAQVHAVGTHQAERPLPYLLMEFVPGARTITDYVKEESVTDDAALGLFVHVCRGVQAGHAKGVIHRDLKPENILIDGDGQPKVIDFGIARVARDDERADTPKTTTGEIVGTVPYMSPEQFTGKRDDVDTRSDVYALGVVLYETLTGRLPYTFGKRGLIDVIRMIQTERPTPPESVRPELAGDVAIILGKALAKDPATRYASAAALADDIERFLEQRPILARPPSLRYQIGMYARRHKVPFAALLGVAATVIGALIAVSVFAAGESRARQRAEQEEARARSLLHASARFIPEVAAHLDKELANITGTSRARQRMATKLSALALQLSTVEGAGDDPEVAHALGVAERAVAAIESDAGGSNVGKGSDGLERFKRAVGHFGDALAQRPQETRFRSALLAAQLSLVSQYQVLGQLEEAQASLERAGQTLAGWGAAKQGDAAWLAQQVDYERTRGHLAWERERPEEALEAYKLVQQHLRAFASQPGEESARQEMQLRADLDLATTYVRLGRGEEARPHIAALRASSARLDERGPNARTARLLWHVRMKLGEFAADAGEHSEAARYQEQALASAEQAARADAHDADARMRVRVSRGALGESLQRTGQLEDARRHLVAGLAAVRIEIHRDPDNDLLSWDLRVALLALATVEGRRKDFATARTLVEEARVIQAARSAKHPERVDEITARADIEYTAATIELARAQAATTVDDSIDAYQRAARRLGAARAALAPLEEAKRLPPAYGRNMKIWADTITALQEAITQLEATR